MRHEFIRVIAAPDRFLCCIVWLPFNVGCPQNLVRVYGRLRLAASQQGACAITSLKSRANGN